MGDVCWGRRRTCRREMPGRQCSPWQLGVGGGPSLALGLQHNALHVGPLGAGGMGECMERTLGVRPGCDTASCLKIRLGVLCGREETNDPRTRPLASRLPTLPHHRRGKWKITKYQERAAKVTWRGHISLVAGMGGWRWIGGQRWVVGRGEDGGWR